MKQSFHFHSHLLLFLFLVLVFSRSAVAAARPLTAKHGKMVAEMVKVDNKLVQSGVLETEEVDDDSWKNLMGMEDCGNGDEACLKRRMVAEAHLDYIYTQHHKP
ncbi:putative phytosulfokines 6 [Telopea speciosissima]|uniref:putative phytosulfokines 6 n=1 Tax=Telopea speciosissima TaxID=54955 RepID=UPI001CC7C1A0|nr:putative phytosulfokines 6 [Telopea speciosissima]